MPRCHTSRAASCIFIFKLSATGSQSLKWNEKLIRKARSKQFVIGNRGSDKQTQCRVWKRWPYAKQSERKWNINSGWTVQNKHWAAISCSGVLFLAVRLLCREIANDETNKTTTSEYIYYAATRELFLSGTSVVKITQWIISILE